MLRRKRLTRRARRRLYAAAGCTALALAVWLMRAPRPAPLPAMPAFASHVPASAKRAWRVPRRVAEGSFDLSKANEESRRLNFPENSLNGFVAAAVKQHQDPAVEPGAVEEPAPADTGELVSEEALRELNRELTDLCARFAQTSSEERALWIERLLVSLEQTHLALSRDGFPDSADEISEAARLLACVKPAARGEKGTRETEPARVTWRIASALRCCEAALARVTGEPGD